jgi:hypothetical protein
MGMPTGFIWIVVFFHEAFKYVDGMEFWYYVGANTVPLSIELCDFVQCLLVYFLWEEKWGLRNRHSVSLSVRLCVPPIAFESVNRFHEIQ